MLEVIKVSLKDILPLILILLLFKQTRITGVLFTLFLLYFHRTPKNIKKTIAFNRDVQFANTFTSPAYGKVVSIDALQKRIQIFLNVYNIHFQFAPCDCTVKKRIAKKGSYYPAFTNLSNKNSYVITTYSTKFGDIQIKQVSGTLAHKIVSFGKIGKTFQRGEKIGFIRFGSRVDISFPPENSSIVFLVQKGMKVKGPSTVIAHTYHCQ
jgi:phosphatidylserine decarboxylase